MKEQDIQRFQALLRLALGQPVSEEVAIEVVEPVKEGDPPEIKGVYKHTWNFDTKEEGVESGSAAELPELPTAQPTEP